MTVHDLALELRERCRAHVLANAHRYGERDLKTILRNSRTLGDDKIIGSYVTCHCCGEEWLSGLALDLSIASATSAEDFLRSMPSSHSHN